NILCLYHPLDPGSGKFAIYFARTVLGYERIHQGQPWQPTPDLPYQNHGVWLGEQNLEKAEIFWEQTLQGRTASSSLGIERIGALEPGKPQYAQQQRLLNTATIEKLSILAQKHHLGIETLFQAAWAWLLHRYNGEDDIVFGVMLSGHGNQPGYPLGSQKWGVLGPLLHSLPIRLKIPADSTPLASWLATISQQQAALEHYGYCSEQQVRHWSHWTDSTPLFNSVLACYGSRLQGTSSQDDGVGYRAAIPSASQIEDLALDSLQICEQPVLLRGGYSAHPFHLSQG
ncbi:MAG: hypothetical protein HC768_24270, partial [Acaryochloris sp. CRU_2_0]|nr:hypothetical protein [Acaryochloris sp. CRU_2_0]